MTTLYADFVKETCSAPGTGTFSLAGAATGFQAFSSAFATGAPVAYSAQDGTNWETGIGTYTTSGTTLTRTVTASSNAGGLVNFPGAVTVECVQIAATLADIGTTAAMAARMI